MNEGLMLQAYVDGELDALATFELEARLERDEPLRAQAEALRHGRRLLADQADYHAAPDALRQRIAALRVAEALPAPRARREASPPARAARFGWRAMGAALAFAFVAGIGLNVVLQRPGADDRLAQEVVASHVRATLGEHLLDVESSDHHTVKPWLSSRLDFSPPVPDTAPPGTPFIGGRVDYLAGQPVAALVFRHGHHVVDSFVWPVDRPDRPVAFSVQRGFRLAHWTRDRMAHWVVSDVNPVEFEAIVQKLAAKD